ncbi:CcdB family protein [Sphingomonas sp.]|uniref:CcdB family protein n=1 Tax=Sphingomonas sp. TaxID=28214 RepID=UPI0025FA83ED|nr:CcdB family protein [Sphingomonas sp.]MBV9528935.1 CcdB family protein [Sphingomonas sp.]
MAQFDVHRLGDGLVVDCQADLLSHIASRLVAPLIPKARAPAPARRLNPVFDVDGETYVLITESAGAVPRRELGPVIASLASRSFDITGALDTLISGV